MEDQISEGEELHKTWLDTTNFSLASEQVESFVEQIHRKVVEDQDFLRDIEEAVRNPNVSYIDDRIQLMCEWVPVGREKSHEEDNGEWCGANEFISQFDLNLRGGAYVYSARCCKLTFQ